MPYRFAIDATARVACVEMTGYCDAAILNEATDDLLRDEAWQNDFSALWDLSGTTALDITPDGLNSLVTRKLEREDEHQLTGKLAVVLARDLLLGTAMLTKRLAGTPSRPIEVFSTAAEARAWLGIDPKRDALPP